MGRVDLQDARRLVGPVVDQEPGAADIGELADPGRALGLLGLAGEIGHGLQRVDILGHRAAGRRVDLEHARVGGGLEGVGVGIGQRVLQHRPEKAVRVQGQGFDAAVELPPGEDRGQGALHRVAGRGEVGLRALRDEAAEHRAIRGHVQDRRGVLLADPERAVGQPDQGLGVEGGGIGGERMADPVQRRLGAGLGQRIGQAGHRCAVGALDGDGADDREAALGPIERDLEDRRRVVRARVDPALLDASAELLAVHAHDLIGVAAGDVRPAVAQGPEPIGRVAGGMVEAAADADGEP